MLYKKTHQESKKGALSRNLIKNLKVTNKASLRLYKKNNSSYSKVSHKNLKNT